MTDQTDQSRRQQIEDRANARDREFRSGKMKRKPIPCPPGLEEHRKADYHQTDEDCPAGVRMARDEKGVRVHGEGSDPSMEFPVEIDEQGRIGVPVTGSRVMVDRWALSYGEMTPRSDGEWVELEDYRDDIAELEAEVEKWRKQLADETWILGDNVLRMTAERDSWKSSWEVEHSHYGRSRAEVETLTAERDEARRFGEGAAVKYNALLEDQRILRCAFCDHEYPPDTPPTQHEALTAHVMECPKHPLKVKINQLQSVLADVATSMGDDHSICPEDADHDEYCLPCRLRDALARLALTTESPPQPEAQPESPQEGQPE